MTVFDAHVLIRQGLQTIDSFVYTDMEKEEVDLAINTTLYELIDDILNDIQPDPDKFELNQRNLDLIDRLYITDTELTPTINSSAPNTYYYYDLKTLTYPVGVLHLLQDRSKVSITCKVDGVNTTVTKVVPNVLTKIGILSNVLDNSLTKTRRDSPISNYSNGILKVFYDDFAITKFYIDYIKIPAKIAYSVTITGDTHTSTLVDDLVSTLNLTAGMTVTGSGVPTGTTIASIASLTSIILSAATTTTVGNTSLVFGANGATNMPLSESGNRELIRRTIIYIAKISEQSQQKIVNLQQPTQ